jgi:hypothetical protein
MNLDQPIKIECLQLHKFVKTLFHLFLCFAKVVMIVMQVVA